MLFIIYLTGTIISAIFFLIGLHKYRTRKALLKLETVTTGVIKSVEKPKLEVKASKDKDTYKITAEYTNQLTTLLDKIKNIKDIYNSEDPEIVNEFIKNKILYLDILTIGEFWEDIKEVCNQDLYKIFVQLKNKFIFTDCSSDINILETKKKVKNKNITNIEYQIYLINYYMKSCIHLKDYNGLIQILFDSSRDLKIYKDFFESEYHYFYWIINFILNLINFLINFEEKISGIFANDIDNKACIKQGILFLYTICIKYFREYAKVFKYEIPSFNFL